MPLLGAPQEGAEETRQGVPPEDPLVCRRRGSRVGLFVRARVGQVFLLLTPTSDHTARLCRALIGLLVFVTLLATRQEVSKKRAQAFPLGSPAALPQGIRRRVASSGCLYGQGSGKDFCFPFLLEICAKLGA